MAFRRILCPIDFSPGSDRALQLAARLAKRDHAELVVAHAWHVGEYALGNYQFPNTAIASILADTRRGLEDAVRTAKKLGPDLVSSQVLMGNPWQEVTETLRKDPSFDLVVVGTRGRTGLARVMLGSVAEKIIRHAPCPVLAVHDGDEVVPFRRLLCPIDFSASSRRAVELTAHVVEPSGSEITLLHASQIPASYSKEPSLRTFEDALDREVTSLLARWASDAQSRTSVPVTTRSVIGSAGAEILKLLDDEAFDVVVMGSRGRTGLARALLGSVAEKVIRHAACPVLVARTRGED